VGGRSDLSEKQTRLLTRTASSRRWDEIRIGKKLANLQESRRKTCSAAPEGWCGVRRLRELWQVMAEATGADESHAD
jgi:hypothetical protein